MKKPRFLYGTEEHPREDFRYPKQIKHWFAEFGIHFEPRHSVGYSYRKEHMVGCIGRYRNFRALPHLGLIQVCDGAMDRWANSVGASAPLGSTRAEFRAAMQQLLANPTMNQCSVEDQLRDAVWNIDWENDRIEAIHERWGAEVEWIQEYGPYYNRDRRLVRHFDRDIAAHNATRKYWLKRIRRLSPTETYDEVKARQSKENLA